MANGTPAESATLTGLQKAAILLISVGDDVSAKLVRQLSEEEVRRVSIEVARMRAVPADQAERVLEEFCRVVEGGTAPAVGGSGFAQKMLLNALGADSATKLLEAVRAMEHPDSPHLKALRQADPEQLATFIGDEHPQTVALVLSHLDRNQAGALLAALPPEMRPDVAFRMANLDHISPEVLNRVAGVVDDKLRVLGEPTHSSSGGARAVAEILNGVDSEAAKEILRGIADSDASVADAIRHLMFVFEDLQAVDQAGIKALLARVDRKVLTMALKGTTEEMKQHFKECMSQRGAEMLVEDMEALGPVRLKDVEAARQQALVIANELQSEGQLSIRGAGSEQYVV
jgi:flagellar motor switch protein FliG